MKKLIFIFFSVLTFKSVSANELILQGRVFIANTYLKNIDNANTAFANEGLKKIDKSINFGVEITFPTFRFLEPGMRYTRRGFTALQTSTSLLTNYEASLTQDSVLFLTRIPFIRSSFLRFDIFGGIGGCNTTLKMNTSSSNGQLSRTVSGNWLATPYLATGASIGFGINGILIYAESGFESNKVNGLQKTGVIASNLSTIDLTGTYFMIGIMFDGIKGSKK